MDPYLDIATSLHNNSLTLLVGTGFSRYLTDDSAPRWTCLLYTLTEKIDDAEKTLTRQLFKEGSIDTDNPQLNNLDILVCAQILELEYQNKGLEIRDAVRDTIKATTENKSDKKAINSLKFFFDEAANQNLNINIITTNYDTLLSDHLLDASRIFLEGNPIPQINTTRNVYHIHGSVTRPESIVLTLSDYFRFQNSTGYLSNKFYTLLHETCVVILGYSLGDFNLNSILNQIRQQRPDSFCGADIYYVSRRDVAPALKTFYKSTYGITVIENCGIDRFFNCVHEQSAKAKELIGKIKNLPEILKTPELYPQELLSRHDTLGGVFALTNRQKIAKNDPRLHRLLLHLLTKKKELTYKNGAWEQYEHLADWLLEVANTIDLTASSIRHEFLDIARHSLRRCSERWFMGCSWHAYPIWKNKYPSVLPANKQLLDPVIHQIHQECPEQGLNQINA